ncbi:MAG: hypothetical protein V4710_11880 [Verrucomicrobiota bacterium]
MKFLFYFLTAVFGVFGALTLLRFIERATTGAGTKPVQLILAVIFLAIAWQCLTKARTRPAA